MGLLSNLHKGCEKAGSGLGRVRVCGDRKAASVEVPGRQEGKFLEIQCGCAEEGQDVLGGAGRAGKAARMLPVASAGCLGLN